ncbi:S-adenosylmethionine decarboxylase proenzyme, prokaryotic class 1B [Alloactinosynnema sp. L-07]|uniref:adenosylmethionine decarboxylase n=1 Tax=Alloactinosynnema sp. L-07 TaxID=1653480 RepID=UPI00065EF2E7|nr:adenosylmethionine decarboxylase [Alloactinosynnema sp. L-07]CRK58341.1 S-adenosylmethionine decarboxylase proenzyme, prokaryotic class 1B [Alloactinosynnema sp. L-07]
MSYDRASDPNVGYFAGRHVLAEFDGVDPLLLDDLGFLRSTLEDCLEKAGATVCDVISKQFEPQGVTVLALLSESHASIHTYPEIGSMFVDIFTCGETADPELAAALLRDSLDALEARITTIHRGNPIPAEPAR